jgi:thioredoxin reductase
VAQFIRRGETVQDIGLKEDRFHVRTDKQIYQAQRVIIASGKGGAPRKLGVPGEELAHVASTLDDPERYQGKRILIVGGGNSAIEAALLLSETALNNKVFMSYRGRQLFRASARSRDALERAEQAHRLLILFHSEVVSFAKDAATLRLQHGKERQIPVDHVFVTIGSESRIEWLKRLGMEEIERPFEYSRGPTDCLVERIVGRQPVNNSPYHKQAFSAGLPDRGTHRGQNIIRVPNDQCIGEA